MLGTMEVPETILRTSGTIAKTAATSGRTVGTAVRTSAIAGRTALTVGKMSGTDEEISAIAVKIVGIIKIVLQGLVGDRKGIRESAIMGRALVVDPGKEECIGVRMLKARSAEEGDLVEGDRAEVGLEAAGVGREALDGDESGAGFFIPRPLCVPVG